MNVRISNGMLMALIINMVYAKAIGVTQGMMARDVGQDMWIATILSTIQGSVMMYMTYAVLVKTPQLDFHGIAHVMLGKWIGKLVSLALLPFFIAAFGSVMITYVYHLRDYFLPEVPLTIVIAAPLLIGILGAFHGLEVMARMAFVGLFFIFALNVILLVGSLHELDVDNFRPVLESGLPSVLAASRHNNTDWAMATLMAAIVLPTVKSHHVRGKAGVLGILLGGLLVAMWPILEVGVLSSEVAGQYIVSCMKMARSAHIGQFIHRYEMAMVAFFSVSNLVQSMMCIFCASHAASKIVGLRDYRPALIPICLLLAPFAYWVVKDHLRAMELLVSWPSMAETIAFGLPALLLALRFIYRRKISQWAEKHPPEWS